MDVVDLNENMCCKLNALLDMYLYYDLDTTDVSHIYDEYNTESVEFVLSNNLEGLEHLISSKDMLLKMEKLFKALEPYSPSQICHEQYILYTNSIVCISSFRVNDKCKCGSTMIYKPERSQRICQCGYVENIVALEAKDNNSQPKVSSFNKINRRRNEMLQCIFGIEDKIIPQELLEYLRKCIADDQIHNDRVTCKLLRRYMEKKYASYNNHVVKILYLITGKEKYQPTSFEISRILNLHKLACDLYAQLYPNRSVKNPLFFSKTIEIVFKHHAQRNVILSNIHKPNEVTQRNNEDIWDNIKKEANGQLSVS